MQEVGVVGARQAIADVNFVVMSCLGLFLKFPPVLRTFFLLWHCKSQRALALAVTTFLESEVFLMRFL